MNNKEAPIFPISVNRTIYIDKQEYILSYKHNRIENLQDDFDLNLNLGKFYLTKKLPNKNGQTIQYVSDDNILAKDTINQHVLNNDKFLVQKIVNILEGKLIYNETIKIENDKVLKIVLSMKNGVSLILFTCNIKINILNDFTDSFFTYMRYFKNKSKINENIESDLNQKNSKCLILAKKYSNLSRNIELAENEFLNNISELLNTKKKKIRSLQKEIDGDVSEELPSLEKEESKNNSSFRKSVEDELNQSRTYSLSDLI